MRFKSIRRREHELMKHYRKEGRMFEGRGMGLCLTWLPGVLRAVFEAAIIHLLVFCRYYFIPDDF